MQIHVHKKRTSDFREVFFLFLVVSSKLPFYLVLLDRPPPDGLPVVEGHPPPLPWPEPRPFPLFFLTRRIKLLVLIICLCFRG
jgi:hypothetical protein